MIKAQYPVDKFSELQTPFYYYDLDLLRATLAEINQHSLHSNFVVHYAMKANVNSKVLEVIREAGLGTYLLPSISSY